MLFKYRGLVIETIIEKKKENNNNYNKMVKCE